MAVIAALVVCAATAAAAPLALTRAYEQSKSLAPRLDWELRWTLTGSTVQVAVVAKTTGWVSLGFADPAGGGMKGADVLVGFITDAGDASVGDYWSDAYDTPSLDDCQSWTLVAAAENATHTAIEAERDLDTGDGQDRVVSGTDLPRRLIAAYGSSDDFAYHGAKRLAFRLAAAKTTNADIAALEADPAVQKLEFLSANYTIPTQMTTYESTCANVPDVGVVHLVGMAPIVQASTAQFVHHFVLYGYTSSDCGAAPRIPVEDCAGPFKQWSCDPQSNALRYGTDCDACMAPETCSESTTSRWDVGDYESCEWTPVDFALGCNAQKELEVTACATNQTFRRADVQENPEYFMCDCDASSDDDDFDGNRGGERVLYLWAPGGEPLAMPPEAGFRVGPGSVVSLRLEVHYNNPGLIADQVDNSGISLYYTRELRPHDAGMALLGDFTGFIYGSDVAGASGMSRHRFACTPGCTQDYFGDEAVTIFGVQLHMHGTGTRKVLRHYDRQGSLKYSAVSAEFYDFNFQDLADLDSFVGEEAVLTLGGGDSFVIDCYYDERRLRADTFTGVFGLGSEDEMCDTFVWFWPAVGDDGQFTCDMRDGCEEYCGPEFIDDDGLFERTFGLPCGAASNLTRLDYSTYQGCATGTSSSVITTAAPAASPTVSVATAPPVDGSQAPPRTQDDNNKKSSKTSGSSVGLIVGIAAAIVGLGICISASLCFYAEKLKRRNKEVAEAVEKTTELPKI
mmetsp:Transcript_30630/g.93616  ORF Transcript_30630/g.93616 Transcript_30630/m.93616 type:complete len:738 (-) Transcript_30630:145-2358(-)